MESELKSRIQATHKNTMSKRLREEKNEIGFYTDSP